MQPDAQFRRERSFRVFLSFLSPRLNTVYLYWKKFGRPPDLRHPQSFNEMLLRQKLERFGRDREVRLCADKLTARDFVRERGCADLLVPLCGVWRRPEEICFEALPERFVLKWNFGCGYTLLCPDKAALDRSAAVELLRRWGREPFWAFFSELQYRGIPRRILAEAWLGDDRGVPPEDYKFYCFHGKAACVMLCTGRERGVPRFYFLDRDFRLLRINRDGKEAPADFSLVRPDGLERAFSAAETLSAGFPFVRVDLYLIGGRVFFGELTFTPAAALDTKRLPEADAWFRRLLAGGAE